MLVTLPYWNLEQENWLAENFNNQLIWNNLRNYIPFPYTQQDAHKFIVAQEAYFPQQNFAIKYGDDLAGGIGILLREDIYCMNVELSYWIAQPFWGLGIATQAVALLVPYVFQNFAINRIVAEVFEHNKASMRVLEKNGFHLESVQRKGIYKNEKLLDNYIWVLQKIQ